MAILELRILPPIAIGRLGSSAEPLDAFDLEISEERPLDFRRIVPRSTFRVETSTGAIVKTSVPERIRFKDSNGLIRPVAPFLEVFALTDANPKELVPLTLALLKSEKHSLEQLFWTVEVGNLKIFRRTTIKADKITARIEKISDHVRHDLLGTCKNFLPGKKLPLGAVQFIKPSRAFPEIRLRFTPAAGKVYGSKRKRIPGPKKDPVEDPVINSDELILYDEKKGWCGFVESGGPTTTNPGAIFAGYDDGDGLVSWGYLDDECDGYVSVTLETRKGKPLTARAVIGAGPPTFAPDTLPIRVVSDEIEQILLGPEVQGDVAIEEAEDIVRRALETIRLMNTAVMNGNAIDGRVNIASTMVRQDTADFGRLYEPIMAPSLVDNLAVVALHERIFNALSSGAAPWFSEALRRPDEIGDLSNAARRKMPALMRNADGRALTLTHRQINKIIKAGAQAIFRPPVHLKKLAAGGPISIDAADLTAQLHFRGAGNPFSVLPRTAISNCFPGLEFDFRNLWRRAFEGIVLLENNNYVVVAEDSKYKGLVNQRLVRIDGKRTMVPTTGPVLPEGTSLPEGPGGPLPTPLNPNAVSFMEWSNSLAHVLRKQGQEVECEFTDQPGGADTEVIWDEKLKTQKVKLRVRKFFEGATAALAEKLLQPGELTQGLCAPWQNDYRECACYYWAASRPDYVNVEPGPDGLSHGDLWMAKKRTGSYIPDDRTDSRLVSYDDLFKQWEQELQFVIHGKDAEES
jgi:hypothetical protein